MKNGLLANALKHALGAFLAPLLTLNLLGAHVSDWKVAAGAGASSLVLTAYNWATADTAPGKLVK